jgi:hypothetical protein
MICLVDVVVRRNVDYKKEEYLLSKLSETQRLKERLIYNYKPIYEKVGVVQSKPSHKNDVIEVADKLVITYELVQIL